MGCTPNKTPGQGPPVPGVPATPGPADGGDDVQTRLPQYLVGGAEPALLTAIAEQFGADPRVKLLRVAGTAANPTLLVATMPADAAREYQARYRGLATIEEDSPLGLWG